MIKHKNTQQQKKQHKVQTPDTNYKTQNTKHETEGTRHNTQNTTQIEQVLWGEEKTVKQKPRPPPRPKGTKQDATKEGRKYINTQPQTPPMVIFQSVE